MTDYSKQTVAQLRALLKERGIPSTGLTRKAQIIERLEEHDNATAPSEEPAPAEAHAEPEAATGAGDTAATADGADAEEAQEVGERQEESTVEDKATMAKVSGEEVPESAPDNAPAPARHETIQPTEGTSAIDAVAVADGATDEAPEPEPIATAPAGEASPIPATADSSVSRTPVPTHEPPSSPAVDGTQPETAETSRLASPELKEDSRKRKRRSVTPPIDAEEAANKKLKQDDAVVHLKEDGDVPEVKTMDVVMAEADVQVGGEAAETVLPTRTSDDVMGVIGTNAPETSKEAEEARSDDPSISERGQQVLAERAEQRAGASKDQPRPSSSHKPPRDARYKSLFSTAAGGPDPTTAATLNDPANPPDDDDRPISPALHPATRGLYVRNFMRPLQPAALRNHLIALASPPSTSTTSPDVLELFHLDPIRTHVLALFDSVSAAARVRSALHGAVWPVERSRKPLWADFVPEEKVGDWIAREEREGGGSGRMGKRWEVVYEPVDGEGEAGVRAELREAGASSAPQPSARAPATAGAPSPAAQAKNPPTGPAAEKSFVALDKLFRSTTVKPKLYFLPVEKAVADKRLDELDRSTSKTWRPGDASGTERRYTFEDGDVLVDAGPDAETNDGVRGRGRVQYRGDAYGPGGGAGGGGPRAGFRDRGWGPQYGSGAPPPPGGRWRR